MVVSHLENKFERYWKEVSNIPLERQYTDDRVRGKRNRLPFDFRIAGTNILIEIQGATHRAGTGHTTGNGIKRDCIKSNAAQLTGYICLHYTASMITKARVQELANYVHERVLPTTDDKGDGSRRRKRRA